MVSPAFTGSKMGHMFELLADTSDEIVHKLLKRVENGERINAEMKDVFSQYACDVIASCAYGLKVDSFSEPDNQFYMNAKAAINFASFRTFLKMFPMSTFPNVAHMLGLMDKRIEKSIQDTVLNTMEIRMEKNIYRPDMINMIMEIREGTLKHQSDCSAKENDGFATTVESDVGKTTASRTLTDDELTAQCFIFIAGGLDTTSNVLMTAAYELAVNPDVQQKLYEEICEMNQQQGAYQLRSSSNVV